MTNKSELYTIMLMHECRVRRNDATNHQKRRYEKEISLFQPLSLSLNYTTNVKRTVTTPYVHTYELSVPPNATRLMNYEIEFISRLDSYSYTPFFVSISHSVSRFIFMKYTVNVCCLFAQLIYRNTSIYTFNTGANVP